MGHHYVGKGGNLQGKITQRIVVAGHSGTRSPTCAWRWPSRQRICRRVRTSAWSWRRCALCLWRSLLRTTWTMSARCFVNSRAFSPSWSLESSKIPKMWQRISRTRSSRWRRGFKTLWHPITCQRLITFDPLRLETTLLKQNGRWALCVTSNFLIVYVANLFYCGALQSMYVLCIHVSYILYDSPADIFDIWTCSQLPFEIFPWTVWYAAYSADQMISYDHATWWCDDKTLWFHKSVWHLSLLCFSYNAWSMVCLWQFELWYDMSWYVMSFTVI